MVTGTYVDPKTSKVTLQSFYDDWSQRQLWATSTRANFESMMKDCSFRDIEVGKLRRSHVEAWVKSMEGRLAPGTIRTRIGNLRTLVRGAIVDRVMTADPSLGVRLPRLRRTQAAMRIPSPEQVGGILEAAEEWFRPFVALTAFAGLRIGEVAGVQAGDIAFLKRTLQVTRQVQNEPGELVVKAPTHGSERPVPLPDDLVALLSKHVADVGVHGEAGWLMPGRPPNPDSLSWHFGKTLERAGVTGYTPHDMRHFYASGLIAAGCDVVTVQRALGHASASTTLRVYSHLWADAEDRTRSAAATLMRSARPSADSVRTERA
ncbi:tyrosine-type recombinase/integrase [Curtobacterium citreum]|uniref:tyrosine-type recombinase/integrase n=1 Tax=Curtobacterium citreum TaxID=2036 RepID=UPI0025432A35|nr:site-specific integrase [Curtobacterium citreum]WIJ46179.1 tyrosine-type recombinase/integrase [Curtobacterium citreum]